MTYHVQFPGLGLEFTLDRVAFTVFGMPIYWYGILIATGLALAIVFAFSHARRFGIDSDRMVDVILIGTVCAVIGGRAFYVATAPFEYASFAEMLDIRLGGVGIYGAIIAAFVSGWLLCKWRKVPVLPMFDLASMGFLIGQCIGRWGNFVNQEAYGNPVTDPAWQFFPAAVYIEREGGYFQATFFYESAWCFLVVALLLFQIIQLCTQHLQRLVFIFQLALFILAGDNQAGGQMGDAYSTVRAVDVLPAVAGGAVGIDAQILGVQFKLHFLGFQRGLQCVRVQIGLAAGGGEQPHAGRRGEKVDGVKIENDAGDSGTRQQQPFKDVEKNMFHCGHSRSCAVVRHRAEIAAGRHAHGLFEHS